MRTTEKTSVEGALFALKDQGIKYVGCRYSGGGDSGAIDEIIFANNLGDDWDLDSGYIPYEEGGVEPKMENIEGIKETLMDLFHEVTNNIEDWWNNEGGYGSVILDTNDGEFKISNNCFYQEEKNYQHCGKIDVDK